MSDRELLELAAKAAGIPIYEWCYNEKHEYWCGKRGDSEESTTYWSPIADDGDRVRLARAIGMTIDFKEGEVWFALNNNREVLFFIPGNEAEEAIAVVRAAAEIGRSMKP